MGLWDYEIMGPELPKVKKANQRLALLFQPGRDL